MWFYLWALFLEGATAQHGPFALHVESKQLIGYDDLESARQKAEYVLAEGLAGASLSTLDLDDFNNLCCQVFVSMPDPQYKMIVFNARAPDRSAGIESGTRIPRHWIRAALAQPLILYSTRICDI